MEDVGRLIVMTRRRIRIQAALDGGMLALGSAVLIAASAVVLLGLGTIGMVTLAVVLAIAGATVAIGSAARALRPLPDLAVAHQIDVACRLGDRVRTALELAPQLDAAPAGLTADLMRAAVRDGIAAAARVTARQAAPLRWPHETRFAAGIAVFAIAIALPTTELPAPPQVATPSSPWTPASPAPDEVVDPALDAHGTPALAPLPPAPQLPVTVARRPEATTPPAPAVATDLGPHGYLPGATDDGLAAVAQHGHAVTPERQRSGRSRKLHEEVLHNEHVPAAYRAYLKRYFQRVDDFAFPE